MSVSATIPASFNLRAVLSKPFFLQHGHFKSIPPLALAPELLASPSFLNKAYFSVTTQRSNVRRIEFELNAVKSKCRKDVFAKPA
jgi:hypothetical protein